MSSTWVLFCGRCNTTAHNNGGLCDACGGSRQYWASIDVQARLNDTVNSLHSIEGSWLHYCAACDSYSRRINLSPVSRVETVRPCGICSRVIYRWSAEAVRQYRIKWLTRKGGRNTTYPPRMTLVDVAQLQWPQLCVCHICGGASVRAASDLLSVCPNCNQNACRPLFELNRSVNDRYRRPQFMASTDTGGLAEAASTDILSIVQLQQPSRVLWPAGATTATNESVLWCLSYMESVLRRVHTSRDDSLLWLISVTPGGRLMLDIYPTAVYVEGDVLPVSQSCYQLADFFAMCLNREYLTATDIDYLSDRIVVNGILTQDDVEIIYVSIMLHAQLAPDQLSFELPARSLCYPGIWVEPGVNPLVPTSACRSTPSRTVEADQRSIMLEE